MDKEPTLSLVWAWALFGGALGASAWFVRWWLGFPIATVVCLFFVGHWVELADPFVGPAIRAEAGASYYWHSAAATAVVIIFHAVGALVGHRRRRLQSLRPTAVLPNSGLQQTPPSRSLGRRS
jgi:hypothetical protein